MNDRLRAATENRPRKMLAMGPDDVRKKNADARAPEDGPRWLGGRIARAMEIASLTPKDLQARLDLATTTAVSRWLVGSERAPLERLLTFRDFARGFALSLAEDGGARIRVELDWAVNG